GHEAVGEIAERNLTAKGRKMVLDILGAEPLSGVATFPDSVRDDDRFDDFSAYHFFNAPPGTSVKDAEKLLEEVFYIKTREWRGFPDIPNSVYELRDEFSQYNARQKFDLHVEQSTELATGCICGPILRGVARPEDCELFKEECTPTNPVGACMVSKEGTCNIAYRYGSFV
ncbi:MAG TPA: S1/P1 nuclease, partial [Methanobacteriaceae archaeon]|nr:S1/P1 nuclease [Methanobacteriaceae archaeon]